MNAQKRVNETLLDLIRGESIRDMCLLDVGCGSGALTFAIAPEARYVVGIDISKERVEEAKRHAMMDKVGNVSFHVRDAYTTDYRSLGDIDMVISNLCMSDEIITRSYGALREGSPLAFACFHSENLKELGRRSRFSYTKSEMKKVLERTGFVTEYLEVEKEKVEFDSKDEALDYFSDSIRCKWQRNGRWDNFLSYLEGGGRSITKSILVVKARR